MFGERRLTLQRLILTLQSYDFRVRPKRVPTEGESSLSEKIFRKGPHGFLTTRHARATGTVADC